MAVVPVRPPRGGLPRIFLETIRDVKAKPPSWVLGYVDPPGRLTSSFNLNRRITAHEILHQLGLWHDAAIMCARINMAENPLGDTITADRLKLLRFVEQPGTVDRDQCP